MNINTKYINAIIFPISAALLGYSTCTAVKDAKNYKGVNELKSEIQQKDPKRYDSLLHDGVSRHSFIDWQYEVNRMNDSLKIDSIAKRAYFEGAQKVRDSIKEINNGIQITN
jgi:protein-arginine kinase activator protein McsA